MKKMKKLVSLLLAVVMVMAMTVNVFATDSNANLENHIYKAYQIFSGTQAENSTALGQVVWGDDINVTSLLSALQGKEIYSDCTDAADVAKVLADNNTDTALANEFAELAYQNLNTDAVGVEVSEGENSSFVKPGYYLIVDVTEFDDGAENTVWNLALLQVSGDTITIQNKTDVPTVEKKVKEKNDSTGNISDWQDSADYDLNDLVPFQLTGTLPTDYANYETYKYVFHDTLSAGLTYNNDAQVYSVIGGTETKIETGFTVNCENGNLTISCENLKNVVTDAFAKIVVRYNAVLNGNSVIGYAGNPNRVYLEYSNNPNHYGEGQSTVGKTPEDVVIVFTYELDVNKIGANFEPLVGAGFTLYKYNLSSDAVDKYDVVKTITPGETTKFTFERLDAGKYKIVETTVPDGYNKAADIEFTITSDLEVESDSPVLKDLKVDKDEIKADTVEIEGKDFVDGTLSTDIMNQQGGTLPETGGMGTTILYVVGTILVLGAAILLITKRRMNAE